MRTLKRGMKRFHIVALMIVLLISPLAIWMLRQKVKADNVAQTLPFSQNWTNTGLITADDNWSGVPGIEGYRGDNLTAATGTDPQTLLAGDDTAPVLDVIANQTNPNTLVTGGVAEFHITDPVVALQGSGTADAPYLRIYLNTTGMTNITVSYNVRDIDGSADNAIQQVALHFRVGSSGNFTNIPAAYIADATTGPSLATLVTPVSVMLPAAAENQPLVQLRIMTTNAVGNDEWVGIDDISITTAGAGQPVVPTCPASLSTTTGTPTSAGVSATDADGTVTSAVIQSITPSNPGTITLIGFTPAAGVGGTATATLDVGAATPPGNYNVTIRWSNNDPIPQIADCTVSVMVASPPVQIHDIQGSGNTSPLVSTMVTTTGIVTGVRNNGFFIQEPDATVDANPATSEGIFVFTSSAPPAAAAVGNLVQVSGTASEFIPSSDPFSLSLTEISGSPSVSVLSMGNPLPAAVPLTATFPDPAGSIDQLERLEGMRVSAASLTVSHPTDGNVTESSATSTSNGVFYGVITGVARPFREPGIEANDPPPAGSGVTIPPVPRFDANPERIRVDSDGLTGGTILDVATGAVVTNLVGPLDYAFRTYSILPDPLSSPGVSGGMTATPCPIPAANEFTVASFNMERFFDTVDDAGIGDVVLTVTAFNNRLNKASLAIRNFMRFPDVIGVEEVENLTTLQAVATKVNNDAVAASQPDPMYQAFLVEGNDPGGIDVGFLVKSARVSVIDVTQFGLTDTYINPNNGMPEILNDRPPLVLRASISGFAFTVIVNHLRSLLGIDDPADGNRVRTKRRAQAEFLANFIQSRQTGDPTERIISVGDYNVFQFNDGFVDLIGTIKGTPTPMGEVVLASPDLVNPDLTDLIDMAPAAERYSFLFDGNAQVLDHELITSNLLARFSQICYTRVNSDFPEIFRSDPNRPERLSDHDMPVAYFTLPCEITCPPNISVSNDTAQCGAIVTFSTMSLNCAGVTCTPASGSFFPVGVTTVNCVESASASAEAESVTVASASCSFTVTVNDTQSPVVNCPSNISTSNDMGQCSAIVNFTATPIDNCPGATVNCNPASGSSFPVGITTVTCTATDASNNMSPPCNFTVTVNDTQNPSVTCPSNISTTTAGSSAVVNYTDPMPSDNCPGATVLCSPSSGTSFPVGTTTVTCTATDASGNTGSCNFTVTVTQSCTIDCPTNITVNNAPGQCAATVTFSPTTTGSCGTVSCAPTSGSSFPVGTTTVTCSTTAGPGCSFTVTVNDTQPPQISCAPLTVIGVTPTPGGSCAVVNYALPTATDNCSGVMVACVPPPGSCFPVGTTTINCTATDAAGNSSSTAVSCPSGGSGISVVVFDICLQDDSNSGRVLLFNSQTGDYVFCCGGVQFSGKGVIIRKGNTISLNHSSNNPSRRVSATVTIGGVNKGEATLQSPAGTTICTIKDSNILNNTCACGGTT